MTVRVIVGALVGGVIGFAVGAGVYLLVNPMLEGASGLLRETQGLLWNLVPFLTFAGALIGALVARSRGAGP